MREDVASDIHETDAFACLFLYVRGVVENEVQKMLILPNWWSIGNG
jgi:hypothetical protein